MAELSFYAHSREADPNPENWQELQSHLEGVANRAAGFSETFSSSEWGYLAGLWHDLGKYQKSFQAKLLGQQATVEHSGLGAAFAFRSYGESAIPLAFAIMGHHAGLANLQTSGAGFPSPLQERLKDNERLLDGTLPSIPPSLVNLPIPDLPQWLANQKVDDHSSQAIFRRRTEFWTRFLFSALVDADRLDTEEFNDPASSARRGSFPSLGTLRQRLDAYIDQKISFLTADERESPVNTARARFLAACRLNSQGRPGFYSLTVPTGGGKTLSAMSFALRHAEHNSMRRVIVVIPYTSIIEQNAREYRNALGMENVVEHHSGVDPIEQESVHGEETARRLELACENWDAPVIVTTGVQFLETLFSNRPSRCRKLHNVARSVIVFDEVQILPPGFLISILDGLNDLVDDYQCSIVLATATPPALAKRDRFPCGLEGVSSIVGASGNTGEGLKRVDFTWPRESDQPLEWSELAEELAKHRHVLAVVHKRDDARRLARELQRLVPHEPVVHLSALMCAAHRLDVLARIRGLLRDGAHCRVVSTQLVEAGVDLDFPVVYRAMAGLDSVVQAGGRCNREGRLDRGQVVIFRARTSPPRGTPRRGMEVAESLLNENQGVLDLDDPRIMEKYFRMLYFAENLDARGIQTSREQFNYAIVGRDFRLIEDGFTSSVVATYGDARKRLDDLLRDGPNRQNLRALQPFIVNIYPDAFQKLLSAGALYEVEEDIYTLSQGFDHLYDDVFGLITGDEPASEPRAFIV